MKSLSCLSVIVLLVGAAWMSALGENPQPEKPAEQEPTVPSPAKNLVEANPGLVEFLMQDLIERDQSDGLFPHYIFGALGAAAVPELIGVLETHDDPQMRAIAGHCLTYGAYRADYPVDEVVAALWKAAQNDADPEVKEALTTCLKMVIFLSQLDDEQMAAQKKAFARLELQDW